MNPHAPTINVVDVVDADRDDAILDTLDDPSTTERPLHCPWDNWHPIHDIDGSLGSWSWHGIEAVTSPDHAIAACAESWVNGMCFSHP